MALPPYGLSNVVFGFLPLDRVVQVLYSLDLLSPEARRYPKHLSDAMRGAVEAHIAETKGKHGWCGPNDHDAAMFALRDPRWLSPRGRALDLWREDELPVEIEHQAQWCCRREVVRLARERKGHESLWTLRWMIGQSPNRLTCPKCDNPPSSDVLDSLGRVGQWDGLCQSCGANLEPGGRLGDWW